MEKMKLYEVVYEFEGNKTVEKAKSIVIAENEEECEKTVYQDLFVLDCRFGGFPINFIITEIEIDKNRGLLCTEAFY